MNQCFKRKNAAKPRVNPSHELPSKRWLRTNLSYDKGSGSLTWKIGSRAGQPAAKPHHGQLKIQVKDSIFLASRIVLKMEHPDFEETNRAFFINGDPFDIRFANLQLATHHGEPIAPFVLRRESFKPNSKTRSKPLPSFEEVAASFCYDPETGLLDWRVKNRLGSPRKGDDLAPTTNGYIKVHAFGRVMSAHRLAWLLHYGEDPGIMLVDHINGNRSDNRIINLRLVTHSEMSESAKGKTEHGESLSCAKSSKLSLCSRSHGRS